jgi:hypothetical protein
MKKIDLKTVIGVVVLGAVLGVQFAYALLGGF